MLDRSGSREGGTAVINATLKEDVLGVENFEARETES
jgi:hypothetical protein